MVNRIRMKSDGDPRYFLAEKKFQLKEVDDSDYISNQEELKVPQSLKDTTELLGFLE